MDQWRRPTDKLRDEIERLKAELGQVREILGDREAEIEQLRAKLTNIHEMSQEHLVPAWQSIETAPKDGTHFLAWSEGYGPTEARFDGTYNDGEPAWVACHQDTDFHPTHWMPLPGTPGGRIEDGSG